MKILILNLEKAQAKNNSEYLRIRYVDENKLEKAAVMFAPFPDMAAIKGKVCEVAIRAGNPTDKIETLEVTADDPAPFIRATKQNVEQMLAELKEATTTLSNPDLVALVNEIVWNNQAWLDRFKQWPAATAAHHAFVGGLLEHTWGMFKIAQAVGTTDPSQAGVNMSVVYAAVLLHDFGKIITYQFAPGSGAESNSLQYLLGHICVADEMIVRACYKLQLKTIKGDILNLRHCILSHHGKKEWGSPIIPSTREAVLVHQIDMMQSRGEMALEGTEGLELGKAATVQHRQLETTLVRL
jgi:3'-5' exoribonuclease